jgi:ABC-type multidrug transport system fused ATPase/permease subunit
VEFKDISFAYNGIDPVLERLFLHITPGEQVAIVGPSRVSKTTLISLILRFYRPLQGEIFFHNRPASNYDLSSLLRRIGYASQNPLLLAGTILDNLHYGDPQAPLEKVIEAAKAAGIHDFIPSLPELTRGKTVFLVAHRLATVQQADRILLLNEKRIVDFDTHAELLGRSVFYRTLFASQNLIQSYG